MFLTYDKVFLFFLFCAVTATILLLLIVWFYNPECKCGFDFVTKQCIAIK